MLEANFCTMSTLSYRTALQAGVAGIAVVFVVKGWYHEKYGLRYLRSQELGQAGQASSSLSSVTSLITTGASAIGMLTVWGPFDRGIINGAELGAWTGVLAATALGSIYAHLDKSFANWMIDGGLSFFWLSG